MSHSPAHSMQTMDVSCMLHIDRTGTVLGGEDACQRSLNDAVYGEVQWVSSAKFDGTSTWDELQRSINPHIANFDNEF